MIVELDEKTENERILYGFWLSPDVALVAHVLKESNIPFRHDRVSAFVGGTQSDEHKARNPLGKVPSLEDTNATVVSESQAICWYLARTYGEAQEIYRCGDAVRCAEVDAMKDFLTFSTSGAIVVDNQLINQPILALFGWDGGSLLTPDILSRVEPIRNAVLTALDEIAPKSMSYALTNALEDTAEARDLFERIAHIASSRESHFVPVVLSCDLEEQLRRVVSQDRTERLKISDARIVRKYIGSTKFLIPDRSDLFELDTTSLDAADAAELILSHVESL